MSKIKVDTIESRNGTLTVGAAGDTVVYTSASIPNSSLENSAITINGSSVSLGGSVDVGGAIDWQTTTKTTAFTAVAGEGYFVDTSSGAITATLPASPSGGDQVAFKDYAANFATNNLTIARNGSNIQGNATDSQILTNRASVVLVYVDATKGWLYTNESNVGNLSEVEFVAATGGTITTSGNYKIHTFTTSGTFTVTNAGNLQGSNTVDYLVLAGGAGGGAGAGGGGGAGGFRESVPSPAAWPASPLASSDGALPVSVQGYPVTVGGGGGGGSGPTPGSDGGNSVFSTITSTGGGGGGSSGNAGEDGGSGGGGSWSAFTGGSGNTPSVSPPQGNDGGNGVGSTLFGSGGGGGAGQAGINAVVDSNSGAGGAGVATSINASSVTRAGGGGGGSTSQGAGAGAGGSGGGGAGAPQSIPAVSGTANTGSGGGGGSNGSGGPGSGGSGVVIIRYKFQ